jgi:outer membrane protein TolC
MLAFVLVASAFAGDARAEGSVINRFVVEVLARNPSLRAAALRRHAFRQEAAGTGTYPDPALSVMLDGAPGGAEMPMIRYELSQMVPWPGKLDLMRDAVERQADAALADLELLRLNLRLEAKRGYAMLLLNAKRRQVNRAARQLAEAIADAALGRYGAGTGDHHEVARAQVELAALDVEWLNLEGERVSMVAMLNAFRDRPSDTAISDPGDIPSQPVNEPLASMVERAMNQRPELRRMRAMGEEALSMARLARKEAYPDLMGSVWVNQNMGGPPSFGVMVGGTIPLFGVSRQQHRAAAFDARAGSASQEQAAMRAMIRFEITDAFTRLQTASRQLDLIRSVALPRARESFEVSITGYSASTLDVVGLLDARRALQDVELALAQALVAREIAHAELERAVGTPISGAVQ